MKAQQLTQQQLYNALRTVGKYLILRHRSGAEYAHNAAYGRLQRFSKFKDRDEITVWQSFHECTLMEYISKKTVYVETHGH